MVVVGMIFKTALEILFDTNKLSYFIETKAFSDENTF